MILCFRQTTRTSFDRNFRQPEARIGNVARPTTHATEIIYSMMSFKYAVNDKCIVTSPPYLSRIQPKLAVIVDDMPSLTNALFLRHHHIWRMVPF